MPAQVPLTPDPEYHAKLQRELDRQKREAQKDNPNYGKSRLGKSAGKKSVPKQSPSPKGGKPR